MGGAADRASYADHHASKRWPGLLFLNGTYAARPSCATQGYWMIKDENSAAGKRQLAALLAARATGAEVTVIGFNACTRWGDGEDVDAILY